MKVIKIGLAGLILAVLLLTTSGMGAIPPQNTFEIQALQTTTGINAVGIVTENDVSSFRLSSEVLDNNVNYNEYFEFVGPEQGDYIYENEEFVYVGPNNGEFILVSEVEILPEPPLSNGEVQMTIAYDETTNALNGEVTYIKNSALHTGGQTIGNYNTKNSKTVTFQALDGGKMTSEENMMLDNVGKSVNVRAPNGDLFPATGCPFSPYVIGNCTPAFCNIVQTGSKVDVYVGSLVTSAQSRSVGSMGSGLDEYWPPIPVVDGPPVEMDYSIRLGGVGAANAAEGSAMAYLKAHTLEGAKECPSGFLGAAQEMSYSEVTAASGSMQQFQKVMNYQSGMNLVG